MSEYPFVAYRQERLSREEMLRRGEGFYRKLDARRSVRHFSTDPVSRELIEIAIFDPTPI